jgi:hypothetical protein
MRERAERKGYKNGTKFNSLESQIMYDERLNGLLPTPTCNDATNMTLPPSQDKRADSIVKRILTGEIKSSYDPKTDGGTSRLSPLFTEEMMGFPFLWTTLPFLKQDGEPKHSKPMETP